MEKLHDNLLKQCTYHLCLYEALKVWNIFNVQSISNFIAISEYGKV